VLLGLALLWNVWLFWPRGAPSVSIPYSSLLVQVRANNVKEVSITGDQIGGTFAKPVTAPQVNPTVTPTDATQQAQISQTTYTTFNTVFPQAVGDPALMPLLQQHNVTIDVAEPSTPWFITLLSNGLPFLLLIGLLFFMGRQATQAQAGVFNFGRTRARRYSEDSPTVTFADVAGADEAKQDLAEVVEFLKNPEKYHRIGARIPRGTLLVGPPGTGKTLLARAVAGEAGVPFFSISASEFIELFVGVGASRVRDLFNQAKAAAPAIIFIDELDAVARSRGGRSSLGTNDEREQTLNQLLVEMDGFEDRQEVIVLAATNRPDVLDQALLRPGRFDRQVEVPLPDRQGRVGILRIHTRQLPLDPDVDLERLASITTGFSGADLANLANEAALTAGRLGKTRITMSDFEEALDKVRLGAVRPLLLSEQERRVTAYHEAGHTVAAWYTAYAEPVDKVTIIPRGRALGVTEQIPGEDRYSYSRSYLLARLVVMLGGRTAEEVIFGDVTTGAENDLTEATKLARRMVTQWAMGELGLVSYGDDDNQLGMAYDLGQGRPYSEATAAKVDENIQKLMDERHKEAFRLLSTNRPQLERVAEELLHVETIDHQELVRILGPRPVPASSPDGKAIVIGDSVPASSEAG
jgi:cell division protease FtsH